MGWEGFQGLPVLLKVWVENWQVGEGQKGASLICSSKGDLGEASQSEDNVVEMEKGVMGPARLEISNGLAIPFLGRRERQSGWAAGSPGAPFPPPPRCCDHAEGVCTPVPLHTLAWDRSWSR